MNTYQSTVQQRGQVSFPEFTGERAYMVPFLKADGLPSSLARWQPTVDAMLDGIDTDENVYVMIQQKFVKAGFSQRVPGVHVDGYWNPSISAHGVPGRHSPTPKPKPAKKSPRKKISSWADADLSAHEALILASNIQCSRAFTGEWSGVIGDRGDCSDVNLEGLAEVHLAGGFVYAGNVAMLHESLPAPRDMYRTLVRLNVPGWSPPPGRLQ